MSYHRQIPAFQELRRGVCENEFSGRDDPADINAARDKKWKEIRECGEGAGNIRDILPAADIVARLKQEYRVARQNFLPHPSS